MKKNMLRSGGAFLLLSFTLTACQKDVSRDTDQPAGQAASAFKSNNNDPLGLTFYALAGNTLDRYSTSDPETLVSSASITGLQAGETILGIDFRTVTGQLYALGSASRLYTLDPMSGEAKLVAALTTVPLGSTEAAPLILSGTSFGFDFNPVVDRIRIVSNAGQNLRVNPETGVTLVDGTINPQPAMVNAVAYTNNDTDPATGTELYALDVRSDLLYEIDPPNNGTLIEPQAIKLKLEGDGGLDIAPRSMRVTSDIALGLYEVNKKATLFRIDVATGETKILAKYAKDMMYRAIAISPMP